MGRHEQLVGHRAVIGPRLRSGATRPTGEVAVAPDPVTGFNPTSIDVLVVVLSPCESTVLAIVIRLVAGQIGCSARWDGGSLRVVPVETQPTTVAVP
jgi:hypothetical protein